MADRESILRKREPLTEEDCLVLLETSAYNMAESLIRSLSVRVDIERLVAIKRLDRTSARLTTWLIVLTSVPVVLTGVIALFTIVLAVRH
jgi:hypothetical protein